MVEYGFKNSQENKTNELGRTLVSELGEHLNSEVKVQGWISNIRDQKRMKFLVLRDHTGEIQAVVDSQEKEDVANIISSLTIESAVSIQGKLIDNPKVKLGGKEIQIDKIELENLSEVPLPFNITGESTNVSQEKRLDWRFLDLRKPENLLIFKIQTTAEEAMREFWKKEGFIEIHTPKLMDSPSESGAELFSLEYFGRKAYLAQSPQFYKQMAMAAGFNRVFEIGPVFRANPSFTSRHDTEFTSVDMEMSWINSHEDIMAFEEKWLQHVLSRVAKKHANEVKQRYGVEINVPTLPFPRFSMNEALKVLNDLGHVVPPETKGDLDPKGEKLLGKYVKEKLNHEFLFITDYGIKIRPFYHMRQPDNQNATKSFDLLWKGLEITTGAQREHRYSILVEQAKEKGLNPESMGFYLDIFKYGCPPHGGFGFGLTRMLMLMLERPNVREVTYLYRGPNRLAP